MTLQSEEKRPQIEQTKQNEKAENYPTGEGTQLNNNNNNTNKEEETGSLPEKELINDSKNDPKPWKQNGVTINRLETQIEKMQEMHNKDVEETVLNNAISDIKNILEETNSTGNEAEG